MKGRGFNPYFEMYIYNGPFVLPGAVKSSLDAEYLSEVVLFAQTHQYDEWLVEGYIGGERLGGKPNTIVDLWGNPVMPEPIRRGWRYRPLERRRGQLVARADDSFGGCPPSLPYMRRWEVLVGCNIRNQPSAGSGWNTFD